jgi:ribose transport system permease protein
MKKLLGVLAFLGVIYGAYLGYAFYMGFDTAQLLGGHETQARRIGLAGILTLAAGLVIITGSIDLSLGSQVALYGTVFCLLTEGRRLPPLGSVLVILALGASLGALSGLVVTKLRVQSFIVTLCGMFVFRGAARLLTGDQKTGLGSDFASLWRLFDGTTLFLIMLGVLALMTVMLHYTVYGRYFFAVGSNERASRFAGIPTDRYRILAFVLSSVLVAFYSFLYVMEYQSVNPNDTGTMLELFAIAGAVLGGVSLRGGDGTSVGMFFGCCVIVLLPTVTDRWLSELLPEDWYKWITIGAVQSVVIGLVLLGGAIADETLRRRQARAKA